MKHQFPIHSLAFVFAGLFGAACPAPSEDQCDVGTEGCACTPGGSCDPGLTCASSTCVDLGSGSSDGPSSAEESASASSSASDPSDASASASESEAGGDSSSGSSSEGGQAEECVAAGCTEEYCDSLRQWCSWTRANEFGSYLEDYASCDDCVITFRDDYENGVLTGVYCPAAFHCWANCVDMVGDAGNDAVFECSEMYCVGEDVQICD